MRAGLALTCFALVLAGWNDLLAADGQPAYTSAEEAGPDFELQGEYLGQVKTDEGNATVGVQVIALGDGKFRAVGYEGGLPGQGWDRTKTKLSADGALENGIVTFKGTDNASAVLRDGVLTISHNGQEIGRLTRTVRESPTLGQEPPEGAIVLFDGSSADAFENGRLTEDGLLMVGTRSKQGFQNFTLHLEFRTPFMPLSTGQARGNSGMYLIDRYEVQVLDSFGLEGENNECGGLYSLERPRVNMCLPPLAWQTYDVEFTSPRFNDAGEKTANARITLRHNGVLIYDDFEIPALTPGGAPAEAPGGPLMLQDHGNPVHFRNIWVVER